MKNIVITITSFGLIRFRYKNEKHVCYGRNSSLIHRDGFDASFNRERSSRSNLYSNEIRNKCMLHAIKRLPSFRHFMASTHLCRIKYFLPPCWDPNSIIFSDKFFTLGKLFSIGRKVNFFPNKIVRQRKMCPRWYGKCTVISMVLAYFRILNKKCCIDQINAASFLCACVFS